MSLSLLFTIATSILALLGVAIVVRAVLAIRRSSHKNTCPICQYDIHGLPIGVPCPECGNRIGFGPSHRLVLIRRVAVLILGVVFLAVLPAWLLWPRHFRSAWWSIRYPAWIVTTTKLDNRWSIQHAIPGRPGSFERERISVLRDGLVAITCGTPQSHFLLEGGQDSRPKRLDVNGDGVPERFFRVVPRTSDFTARTRLFVLSESGSEPILESIVCRSWTPDVRDVEGNGTFQVTLTGPPSPLDPKRTAYAVFRWSGGRLAPSNKDMQRPRPEMSALRAAELLRKTRDPRYGWENHEDWDCMIELMYSGNEQFASEVLAELRKDDEIAVDRFRESLHTHLLDDPYWPEINAAFKLDRSLSEQPR